MADTSDSLKDAVRAAVGGNSVVEESPVIKEGSEDSDENYSHEEKIFPDGEPDDGDGDDVDDSDDDSNSESKVEEKTVAEQEAEQATVLINALRGPNAAEVVKRLARSQGIDLVEDVKLDDDEVTSDSKADRIAFYQKKVGEKLDPRFKFLADAIGEVMADVAEEGAGSAQKVRHELAVKDAVNKQSGIIKKFLTDKGLNDETSKDPVTRKMFEIGSELPYSGRGDYELYISRLHASALSELGMKEDKSSTRNKNDKIRRNLGKVEPTAAAGANNKTGSNKTPSNYDPKQAVADALNGRTYDDD